MSAREAIFTAIGSALGPAADPAAIRREAVRLAADPGMVRPLLPDGDLADLFAAAVARLPPGASAERIADLPALPGAVARRLRQAGLPPALKVQPDTRLAALDWAAAGLQPVDAVDDGIALSLAETAIAETASLVLRSGPRMAILDAFLPLHHIVAVERARIVPHLEDAMAGAGLAATRNLVVVTGPSGTTDIEGNLVIGVHGPATLHIVIVG